MVAGDVTPWANTVFPVIAVERINPPMTSKDKIDLFIFPLHKIQLVPGIKKTKPAQGGRFRYWLTTTSSLYRIQRPDRQWVKAPADKYKKMLHVLYCLSSMCQDQFICSRLDFLLTPQIKLLHTSDKMFRIFHASRFPCTPTRLPA